MTQLPQLEPDPLIQVIAEKVVMDENLEEGKFPYLEMVEALSSHDTEFLVAYASDPDCPEGFFALLCAEEPEVQLALAANPKLVDPYISHLIVSGNEDIWTTLVGNPALAGEHLRMILDRAPELMLPILTHPSTPSDLLGYVYERECSEGRNEVIATAVLNHENVPFGVLFPIFRDYESLRDEVVEAFLSSGNYAGFSPDEMRQLILDHPEYTTST